MSIERLLRARYTVSIERLLRASILCLLKCSCVLDYIVSILCLCLLKGYCVCYRKVILCLLKGYCQIAVYYIACYIIVCLLKGYCMLDYIAFWRITAC